MMPFRHIAGQASSWSDMDAQRERERNRQLVDEMKAALR
jgi:hypothetical protein